MTLQARKRAAEFFGIDCDPGLALWRPVDAIALDTMDFQRQSFDCGCGEECPLVHRCGLG